MEVLPSAPPLKKETAAKASESSNSSQEWKTLFLKDSEKKPNSPNLHIQIFFSQVSFPSVTSVTNSYFSVT